MLSSEICENDGYDKLGEKLYWLIVPLPLLLLKHSSNYTYSCADRRNLVGLYNQSGDCDHACDKPCGTDYKLKW